MTEQPALPAPSELTATIADALANQWAATEITFDSDGNPVLNVSNAPLAALANDPIVLSSLATAFNHGNSLVTWNAPPTAAINYARQRSAELVGMRRLTNGQLTHNPDPKWSLSDTTRDRLRSLIVSNLQSPESMRDLKERIEALPEFASIFGEYRAEMIARTELQVALNNGNLSAINRDGYSHVQVLDSEDCGWTSHDDPDKANGSIRTLAEAREYPIAHPHCLPGDTLAFAPHAIAGYARPYSGDLVHIETVQGRNIAATPHHPVLTAAGWTDAAELQEGTELLCLSRDLFHKFAAILAAGEAQNHHEAPISQIAQSVSLGGLHFARMSAEAFHGDGTDGDIYAVRSNGQLLSDGPAEIAHGISHGILCNGLVQQIGFASLSTEFTSRNWVWSDPTSDVRGSGNVGILARAEGVGFSRVTNDNACFCEATSDATVSTPHTPGDGACRFAGLISRDHVAHVERKPFSGHVYNLSTANGMFVANEIITHNCVRAFNVVIDALKKDGGAAGASGGGIGVGTGLTGYSLEGQRRRCPLNCRNGTRPNGNDCPHKSHTRRRDS